MGKAQQGRDKNYMTASEHASSAGFKDRRDQALQRLPFSYCALSFVIAQTPVCTPDGNVFDFLRIVPWIRQHGMSPVTGEKLTGKDLTRLKVHKNADGQLICPVSHKVLTDHTKVAAVRTTGHVYSWDSLDTLCLRPKQLVDLIDGVPFTRGDVIVLQDPGSEEWLRAHATSGFFHVKEGLSTTGAGAGGAGSDGTVASNSGGGVIRTTDTSRAVLQEMEMKAKAADDAAKEAAKAAAGRKRARQEAGEEEEEGEGGMAAVKRRPGEPTPAEAALYDAVCDSGRKAYVSLRTSLGALNLELLADLVPRTVHNFLTLAHRGYYNGTRFHRLIRGFMVQGGRGSGGSGCSAWDTGVPLLDETSRVKPARKHDARGVMSMANAGPNTGGSQFFLTFGPAPHLDGKHVVFGRLVGGAAVLDLIEAVPADAKAGNAPEQDIIIQGVDIMQDPFAEMYAAGKVVVADRSGATSGAIADSDGQKHGHGACAGTGQAVERGAGAPSAGTSAGNGRLPVSAAVASATRGVLLDDDEPIGGRVVLVPGLTKHSASMFGGLPAPGRL